MRRSMDSNGWRMKITTTVKLTSIRLRRDEGHSGRYTFFFHVDTSNGRYCNLEHLYYNCPISPGKEVQSCPHELGRLIIFDEIQQIGFICSIHCDFQKNCAAFRPWQTGTLARAPLEG